MNNIAWYGKLASCLLILHVSSTVFAAFDPSLDPDGKQDAEEICNIGVLTEPLACDVCRLPVQDWVELPYDDTKSSSLNFAAPKICKDCFNRVMSGETDSIVATAFQENKFCMSTREEERKNEALLLARSIVEHNLRVVATQRVPLSSHLEQLHQERLFFTFGITAILAIIVTLYRYCIPELLDESPQHESAK